MFKRFIRQITPPFLVPLARSIFHLLKPISPIYEGLYLKRDQLPPVTSNPFEHPNWITYVGARAESRKLGVATQDMHEMCLSLISSLACQQALGASRTVIDFGGGVGMYWPAVKAQNKSRMATKFVVVDSPSNCETGRMLFGTDGVEFFPELEQAVAKNSTIHVLNVASTLHYCLEYEAVIALLCRSQATFIIISRHPAPEDGQPVAYAIQNVTTVKGFCGQIPVILLSVQLLEALMCKNGYTLIADYFNDADADKYWKGSKQEISVGYASIIEHAIVFQRRHAD